VRLLESPERCLASNSGVVDPNEIIKSMLLPFGSAVERARPAARLHSNILTESGFRSAFGQDRSEKINR